MSVLTEVFGGGGHAVLGFAHTHEVEEFGISLLQLLTCNQLLSAECRVTARFREVRLSDYIMWTLPSWLQAEPSVDVVLDVARVHGYMMQWKIFCRLYFRASKPRFGSFASPDSPHIRQESPRQGCPTMWLTTITQAYTTQNFGAGRGKYAEKSALQIFGRPHQWKRYVKAIGLSVPLHL